MAVALLEHITTAMFIDYVFGNYRDSVNHIRLILHFAYIYPHEQEPLYR